MTAPAKPKDKRFDPAKIQGMTEPFTVRIEKKKGNASMPVFQKEGLTRDEVMVIENWILTQWTGGGFYEGRVTDAAGANMDWVFVYDPSQYPEKVPPELGQAHANPVVAAAAAAGQTAVMVQPAPQSQSSASQPSPGYPPSMPQPSQVPMSMMPHQPFQTFATPYGVGYAQPQQAQQMAAPQMQLQGYPQMGNYPAQMPQMNVLGQSSMPLSSPLPSLSSDDRVRALETQLRDQLLDKKDMEFKSALSAMQQAHAQQIMALQAELRRFGEAGSTAGNAQVRELEKKLEDQKNAMLEQRIMALTEMVAKAQSAPAAPAVPPEIMATIDQLKAQNLDTQRRLEDEKRQREAERAEERHRQEIAEVRAQMQQLTTSLQQQATLAPNPMLEAVRNMADRMMGVMVNPVQMIELMDRKGNAADGVIKTMMDMMQGIAGMYQQAVQITSSGGPSTTGVIVQEAIGKIGDGIQAAAAAVRDRGVMAEKAKVEQAKAQSAMAQVLMQRAQMQTQAPQGALAGAPVPPPPPETAPQQADGAQEGAPAPAPQPPVASSTNGKQPVDRNRALLGVAYDEVMTLRKGIADGKLTMKDAANAIYQGVAYMRSHAVEIPAFKLLDNEQFADFVETLLPGLKEDDLAEVVNAFVALIENDGVEIPDEEVGGGAAESAAPEAPPAA